MNEGDVACLQAAGLSDRQITVAVQVIGYFNYINRVADGLDVELEDFMKAVSKNDWLADKGKFN